VKEGGQISLRHQQVGDLEEKAQAVELDSDAILVERTQEIGRVVHEGMMSAAASARNSKVPKPLTNRHLPKYRQPVRDKLYQPETEIRY
jgi:hypothetical protein